MQTCHRCSRGDTKTMVYRKTASGIEHTTTMCRSTAERLWEREKFTISPFAEAFGEFICKACRPFRQAGPFSASFSRPRRARERKPLSIIKWPKFVISGVRRICALTSFPRGMDHCENILSEHAQGGVGLKE